MRVLERRGETARHKKGAGAFRLRPVRLRRYWSRYRLLGLHPFPRLFEDGFDVGSVTDAEAAGGLPYLAVLVEPFQRDIVERALVGFVLPQGGFD